MPGSSSPAAALLARFGATLETGSIPADVVELTKLHILDLLGCGLAADALGLAGEGRATMVELGEGDVTVIGLAQRLPAANAAFANAMLCHGLDYDDTHPDSVSHISTAVVPPAMAVAESAGRTGAELIAAVVVATETVARIGMSATGRFHARGFHPTSACGVFGATAAAARLNGLDAETTTRALGIAGSMSSGLLAFLNEGVPTKPIHPAWAAHGGVIAARLAAHGAQGPADVLDGRFGMLEAFLGDTGTIETQVADLGERWETRKVAYKPYPACHFMHGSLGATASILDQVDATQIEEILVHVPATVVAVICEPEAEKLAPRSDYEAKFSVQFSTAAMLLNGRVNLDTYSAEHIADPAVLELARKVRYEGRTYPTEGAAFPGGVQIRTADGRTFEAELPYQLGSADNPASDEEIRQKFRDNASLALDPAAVAELEERICSLELQDDLEAVFAPLTSTTVRV